MIAKFCIHQWGIGYISRTPPQIRCISSQGCKHGPQTLNGQLLHPVTRCRTCQTRFTWQNDGRVVACFAQGNKAYDVVALGNLCVDVVVRVPDRVILVSHNTGFYLGLTSPCTEEKTASVVCNVVDSGL